MVDWDLDEVERVSVISSTELTDIKDIALPAWVCMQCSIGCRLVSKERPTKCVRPMPKPDWVIE